MITDEIRAELYHLQDIKYRDFQSKLIPTVSPDYFIGVRTPELRKLAKQVGRRDDGETYTIRFGIGMLMEHFLDEDFAPEYPEMVAAIRTEEYYVNMMVARKLSRVTASVLNRKSI